jgi:hypothetical protein
VSAGGGSAEDCGAGGVEVEAEVDVGVAGGGAADMVWKYLGVADDFMTQRKWRQQLVEEMWWE